MGRESLALAVGLPDVHLRAAAAEVAGAGVGVVVRRLPVPDVGLAVDPLHVVRALGVAVPGSVLGSSLGTKTSCLKFLPWETLFQAL